MIADAIIAAAVLTTFATALTGVWLIVWLTAMQPFAVNQERHEP